MAYEHNPGSFTLFKNDKGDNEKRPDYRGEGKDLDGNAIEVAAWLRGEQGKRFMSCTFKLKSEKPKPRDGGLSTMKEDLPF